MNINSFGSGLATFSINIEANRKYSILGVILCFRTLSTFSNAVEIPVISSSRVSITHISKKHVTALTEAGIACSKIRSRNRVNGDIDGIFSREIGESVDNKDIIPLRSSWVDCTGNKLSRNEITGLVSPFYNGIAVWANNLHFVDAPSVETGRGCR